MRSNSRCTSYRARIQAALATLLIFGAQSVPHAFAADWPEWRGAGRGGAWAEKGILEEFPPGGLEFKWRTPIKGGYSGPAVAEGRVYVTDFERTHGKAGTERALCLDEETGEILWTHSWRADYRGLNRDAGPRATTPGARRKHPK